jgi:hypothetical protein
MNYCIPDAEQDLENSRRTAQTVIYSGIWNPSIDSTYAVKGTLYIGVGAAVGGMLWQKQDDGCSTNWRLIGRVSGDVKLFTDLVVVAGITDYVLLIDATAGPVSVTLAAPVAGVQNEIYVKKIDASLNAVSIVTLIDGVAKSLTLQGQSIHAVSDGAAYWEL